MLPDYRHEHLPGNEVWDGSVVVYLTPKERASCALTFRDGRIHDASGNLFDSTGTGTLHSDANRAIFVMDAEGNFFASKHHAIGEFHHSSLVAGAPVAAAGELAVVQGELKTVSDKSGHYRPRRRFTRQAIAEFRRNNISLAGVAYDLVGAP